MEPNSRTSEPEVVFVNFFDVNPNKKKAVLEVDWHGRRVRAYVNISDKDNDTAIINLWQNELYNKFNIPINSQLTMLSEEHEDGVLQSLCNAIMQSQNQHFDNEQKKLIVQALIRNRDIEFDAIGKNKFPKDFSNDKMDKLHQPPEQQPLKLCFSPLLTEKLNDTIFKFILENLPKSYIQNIQELRFKLFDLPNCSAASLTTLLQTCPNFLWKDLRELPERFCDFPVKANNGEMVKTNKELVVQTNDMASSFAMGSFSEFNVHMSKDDLEKALALLTINTYLWSEKYIDEMNFEKFVYFIQDLATNGFLLNDVVSARISLIFSHFILRNIDKIFGNDKNTIPKISNFYEKFKTFLDFPGFDRVRWPLINILKDIDTNRLNHQQQLDFINIMIKLENGKEPDSFYFLGKLLSKTENKQEAITALKQAEKLYIENEKSIESNDDIGKYEKKNAINEIFFKFQNVYQELNVLYSNMNQRADALEYEKKFQEAKVKAADYTPNPYTWTFYNPPSTRGSYVNKYTLGEII